MSGFTSTENNRRLVNGESSFVNLDTEKLSQRLRLIGDRMNALVTAMTAMAATMETIAAQSIAVRKIQDTTTGLWHEIQVRSGPDAMGGTTAVIIVDPTGSDTPFVPLRKLPDLVTGLYHDIQCRIETGADGQPYAIPIVNPTGSASP